MASADGQQVAIPLERVAQAIGQKELRIIFLESQVDAQQTLIYELQQKLAAIPQQKEASDGKRSL